MGTKRSGSMRKPTSTSVTGAPCRCGFLPQTAAEPNEAIVFEAVTNEYLIVRPQGGYWIAFHCPMCGGAAPASRRRELFAEVTPAEVERLEQLTADIETVEEAIRILGQPDEDLPRGVQVRTKATRRGPSRGSSYRVLRFKRLSETVDVELVDYRTDGIRFTFQGKYLGKRKAASRSGASQGRRAAHQ